MHDKFSYLFQFGKLGNWRTTFFREYPKLTEDSRTLYFYFKLPSGHQLKVRQSQNNLIKFNLAELLNSEKGVGSGLNCQIYNQLV